MSITLMEVVRSAGFSGDAAYTMYGICTAESGGNAWALNPNSGTGDLSYGLAQINMIGSMGSARRKAFNIQNNNELFNPYTNLKAAWQISSHGTNFGAWSTYNSGAYANQANMAKNGQSDYKVVYRSEYGSPNPNVDQNAGKYLGGSAQTGASGAQTNYATKGHWTSFSGKPIPDPPTPITYGKPTGSDPSGARVTKLPDQSSYDAIFKWLDEYNDGTFAAKWKGQKPDFPTLLGTYTDTIAYQAKGGTGATQYPDPGQIYAGITPPINWAALDNLLSWFTTAANWKRIGLFALGAVILLVAAMHMLGVSNPVGKVVP